MSSRQHAERFLRCLTGDANTPVTFQTFDDREQKDPTLARTWTGTLAGSWDKIVDLNAKGAGIFVTINETDGKARKIENIIALRALFVDFDDSAADPALKPSMIVNSLRGQHYYWLLDGEDDLARFTPAQEQLAKFYGSDPKVKDLPRVMRLPGTLNQKREPGTEVTVTMTDDTRQVRTVGEILAAHPIKKTTGKKFIEESDLDPDSPITEGGRDNKLFQIACDLRRVEGLEEKEIFERLCDINERRCKPPVAHADLRRLAAQGAKKPKGDQSPEQKMALARQLSDVGNAQYFVARFGGELRYTAEGRQWWVWTGRQWQRDFTGAVERKAKEFVNVLLKDAMDEPDPDRKASLTKHALNSQHATRIEAIIKLAKSEEAVAVRPDVFDRDPWLINCRNGMIDLRTGEHTEHDRAALMTSMVNASYDPKAKCPFFDAFLEKVLPDDEVRLYVLRALGSCLVGEQRDQVTFMPFGQGKNGKSVLMSLMSNLLDGYSRTAPPQTFLSQKNDSGNGTEIASLRGSRFVYATESGESRPLNEEQIKRLTGGDKMSVRGLYENFSEFKPGFKLWFAVNHRPVIRSVGFAIWRRIHLIPFVVTISDAEEIPRDVMDRKLVEEADGIFTKLVRYCLQWQRDGLNPPQAVTDAVKEYQADEDPLAEWMEACAVVKDGASWPQSAAYNAYKSFTEGAGDRPLGKKLFGTKMIDKGFQKFRGHGGVRSWAGIGPSSGAKAFAPVASASDFEDEEVEG